MKKTFAIIICLLLGVSMMFSLVACNDTEDPTPTPKRDEKTLMVGDSLFDLWKSDCATDLAGAKNLVNIAIGGTSSIYWQKSEKIIKRENPTTIIMCLGTNDIADLNRTGIGAAQGGDEFDTCLQGVLEMFHSVVPDAHIYCLTINICGESIRWNKRAEIAICNQLMREYCADKDWVEIVETEHAFYDTDDYLQKPNADYFVADYLHFSRNGYNVLKGIVRQAIGLDEKVATKVDPEMFLLIGDSNFDFWTNWAEDLSGLKHAYNIALGGTTAAYWINNISTVVALKPDKIVIRVGSNDLALGKNGKNCAEDNTGLQKMLEMYHEQLPDAEIYWLTISLCGENTRWNKRDQVAICNELMKTYAASRDWLHLIDVEKAFYDTDDYTQKPVAKYFVSDYLHYNQTGYARLSEYLRPALGLED